MNNVFDTICTSERTIIELSQVVDSSWKVLGQYRYGAAHKPRALQSSGETMVIALFIGGLQQFVVNGEHFVMTGGQALCIPPGCEYGTDSFPEQKGELIWLIFDLSQPQKFSLPGFNALESEDWLKAVLKIKQATAFRHDPATVTEAKRILKIWQQAAPSQVELRARLSLLLVLLLKNIENSSDLDFSTPIVLVVKWIENQLQSESCSIEQMAEISGLSVSRFQTRFKSDTGISPADYLQRRKLLEAQRLLEQGVSVTEVAMLLGYSSSQYFATVFKRYAMLSPSKWLKADRNV